MFFENKNLPRGVEDNKAVKYIYLYGLCFGLTYKFYWLECEIDYVSRYRYYRWCYPLLSLFYYAHKTNSPFFTLEQDVNSWHEKGFKIKRKHQHLLHPFKKKPSKNAVPQTDQSDASIENKPSKKFLFKLDDEFGLANKENEKLSLRHDEIVHKDAVFRNLRNCQLRIEGGASTIHFVSLTDCRILCGPVSTSVFVEDCQDCIFVIACQQLRTHRTHDTHFYLHVTSRGIIEDCQRVGFAPYNWHYPNIEKHFEFVGLAAEENNWNLINDFNWLSSAPSPNWKILEEHEQVVEWN